MKIAIFSAGRCRTSPILLPLFLAFVFTGCGPTISNVISSQEYEIYTAWINHHYVQQPEGAFYLETNTFMRRLDNCSKEELRKKGVDSLTYQLSYLGDSKYSVDARRSIHSPWPFEETARFPPSTLHDEAFRVLQFTRVALNWRHTEGLFAISVVRGYRSPENGLTVTSGGGGGWIIAKKQNGKWTFEETECAWVY